MAAELLMDERVVLDADLFVELVIWRLPRMLPGSRHAFKYRLALVERGVCVLRYDNEAGKGDHRHWEQAEEPYRFTTPEALLSDFWTDVNTRRK
ncbi:MAG TPA: DUF6516 family protein [Rhizomicrobium sp.]